MENDPDLVEEVRQKARPEAAPRARKSDESLVEQVSDVLGSTMARTVGRELVKGIFGMLKRRR